MRISERHIDAIHKHLRRELPREGWGIVAGSQDELQRVYPMSNVAAGEVRYACDPAELYNTLKEIEAQDLEMRCIYHSHPPAGAYFSETDLGEAWIAAWDAPAYPGICYLVVGFQGGTEPQEMKSFRVENGKAVEEAVEIIHEREAQS